MGAVVAVVLVAASGAASGQEATPLWPAIGAVGAPATIDAPPVPDAEPAAPGVEAIAPASERDATVQAEPAAVQAAAGGSRLLRALAESTGPLGRRPSGLRGDNRAASRAVLGPAAGACPRALLRRLLAGAAGESDALAALAIEAEILTLCSERQRIVTALFETEARLKELRAPAEPVPVIEAASIPPPTPAVPEIERETHAKPGPPPSALRQALTPEPGEEAKTAPSLGWFSILGSAGALRAGITDGTAAWFVQEGDALPGGGTVAGIAGRPPSVRTTGPDGDAGEPLPFRPRPGGQR